MSNLKDDLRPNSQSPNKLDKAKTGNYQQITSQLKNQHDINLKDERDKYKILSSQNTLKVNVKNKIEEEPKITHYKNKSMDNALSLKEVINTEEYKPTSKNVVLNNMSLDKDLSNVNTRLHKSSNSIYDHQRIKHYNIEGSVYDFVKAQDKIKVGKDDGTFMKRMVLDVFIRQTKDKRLNEMLEKRRIKIDEAEKIKAFNRLLEDANRRMEALDNLESVKLSMEEPLPDKKITYEQFLDLYNR
jgi:hypothetical protein